MRGGGGGGGGGVSVGERWQEIHFSAAEGQLFPIVVSSKPPLAFSAFATVVSSICLPWHSVLSVLNSEALFVSEPALESSEKLTLQPRQR